MKNDSTLSDDGQLTRSEALLLLLRNFGSRTGGILNSVWYWCIHRPHEDHGEWPMKGKHLFLQSGQENVIITGIRNNTQFSPDWDVWDEMKTLAMRNDTATGRGYFRYQDLSSTGPLRPLFERVLSTERQNPTYPWYGWPGKELDDLESVIFRDLHVIWDIRTSHPRSIMEQATTYAMIDIYGKMSTKIS